MKERGPGLAFTAANPLSVGIHSAPNTRIINCVLGPDDPNTQLVSHLLRQVRVLPAELTP